MKTSHRRIALLTGGSAAALGLTMVAATPAYAACVVGVNAVTCATTTTTDTTNAGGTPAVDRNYPVDTSAAAFTGTVSTGAAVDGFGLAFTNTVGGANALNVVNSGSVQVNAGNTPTAGGGAALNITGIGATPLIYSGTGTITNLGGGTGDGLVIATPGTGNITATVGGNVTAGSATTGAASTGISATHSGATGNISLTTATGTTVRAGATGISGTIANAASTGTLTVTNAATIASRTGALGTLGTGIAATNTGLGATAVANNGAIGASTDRANNGINATNSNALSAAALGVTGSGAVFSVADGIIASTAGTGTVTVNYTGAVNSSAGDGIDTSATTGATAITVGGNVAGAGAGNNGVRAVATTGTIGVNVTGGNVSTGTAGETAINLSSTGAMTVTVAAGRTVSAGTTALPGTAIQAGSTGTLAVNNSGTLGTFANGLAVFTSIDNATTIGNLAGGTINGRVDLSNLADTVTNAGTWNTTGVNNFYTGTDVVTNQAAGVINTGTGTTFTNLETVANAGTFNATGTLGFTGVATTFTNSGSLHLIGSTVTGIGLLTNSGTVDLSPTSTIGTALAPITTFTQTSAGTLNLQLLPTAEGTQTVGTYPQVFATTANLAGTLAADIRTPLFFDHVVFQNVVDATTIVSATPTTGFTTCTSGGAFAGSIFLDVSCAVDGAANVDLTVDRVAFTDIAGLSPNALAAASGLECIYDPTLTGTGTATMLGQLLHITDPADFNFAGEMLSGDAYANYLQSFPSLGVHYNDLLDHATNCEVPALAGSVLECRASAPLHVWGTLDFQWRKTDADFVAGSTKAKRFTGLIGADAAIGNAAIVGVAGGYVTNHTNTNQFGDRINADGALIGAYAVYDPGTFFVKAMTTYNWYDGDSSRHVDFTPFGGTFAGEINGDPDIRMWTAGIHGGARFALGGNSVVTPYVNYDYVNTKLKAFNEFGLDGANLSVESGKSTRSFLTGGVKWAGQMGGVVPEVNLGYRYRFGQERSHFTAQFNDGDPLTDCLFDVFSSAQKRGTFLGGVSVGGKLGIFDLRIGYEGEFNGDVTSHSGMFKFVVPLGAPAAPPPVVVAPPPPPVVAPPPPPEPAPPPPPPPPVERGERGQ